MYDDNEGWLVELADTVIGKRETKGDASLSRQERMLVSFWTIDYGIRNAGDLQQAEDVKPGVVEEARRLAAELGLAKMSAALALPPRELERDYNQLFESICDELRRHFDPI